MAVNTFSGWGKHCRQCLENGKEEQKARLHPMLLTGSHKGGSEEPRFTMEPRLKRKIF